MTKFTLPIQYDQFIVLSYTTCIFAQKCPSKYRQIILFSTYIASPRVLLLWYGSFKKCLWIKSLNSRRIAAILILFIQVLLWFFYHCLILRKPKIKYVHQLDSSLSSYFRIYYYSIKINSYILNWKFDEKSCFVVIFHKWNGPKKSTIHLFESKSQYRM